MKPLKTALLTLVIMAFVNAGQAQTVESIINKAVAALGGEQKLAGLKSTYMEMNMEVMGMQMPSKTWILYNNAMRQEVDIQGQKIITYIDKEKGWNINPLMGSTTPQPLPEDAIKNGLSSLSPGRELTSYKEAGFTATLEGSEDVNGAKAYKIKLEKDAVSHHIFIDEATSYLVKSVTKANVQGQEFEAVTLLSDYKKTADNFVFPYTTTISNPMVGEIKGTVVKLEVNGNIDIKELQKTEE
ncbi:MAG: hypothetical protein KIT80_11925 [Chitinophagaceae bacterium]|nr:hypothetical protein [Chitinophagaceae bacterium]MCW5927610.1 hypothetical protein [Chitinophagaceae bacterium]